MNITTIGRGNIGSALTQLWRKAGHAVVCLGRDGGDASDADAVLVAVPSGQVADALRRVTGLRGKVVIDAMNAFDGRDERHESLTHEVKFIVGGPVAKAFNLQHHLLYDHIEEQRVRPSNLYAAEPGARPIAEQLIRDAGFDPVFVGGIEKARALEDCARLFGAVRIENGGPHFHRFARPGNL
jgi:predicted dinucleotide-binding enzyme